MPPTSIVSTELGGRREALALFCPTAQCPNRLLPSRRLYAAYNHVQWGMANRSTGSRFNLGEPWEGDLAEENVFLFVSGNPEKKRICDRLARVARNDNSNLIGHNT